MSDNAIQISGKAANGIIFLVGGNDADDFLVNLSAILKDRQAAEDVVAEAARLITPSHASPASTAQAAQNIQGAFPGATQAPPPARPPAAPASPPGGQPPVCNHGYAREYKTGTSKAGKPYKLWSCPADRSEQCEPVWVK